MRHKLEVWLESLSIQYEKLRVSYVLIAALLLIVVGSLACSTAPPNKPQAVTDTLPATVTNDTKNPLSDLAAASVAGKLLYEKNCSFCHGATGASDGTFEPKPPKLDSGDVTHDPDGEIFLTVKNGKGKSMPAQKRMTDQEIWQVTAYVRALAKK